MLVIARRVNEEVWIGSNIRIQILRLSQKEVRLGITAPREIPVARDNMRDWPDASKEVAERFPVVRGRSEPQPRPAEGLRADPGESGD